MENTSEQYLLFPGVTLSAFAFQGASMGHTHPAERQVLSILYCQDGRIGWTFPDGSRLYLTPGDIVLNAADLCCASQMDFPLGHCRGLWVSMDLDILREEPLALLENTGISCKTLYDRFCVPGRAVTIRSTERTRRLFADSQQVPAQMRLPYFQLKVQELLLTVFMSECSDDTSVLPCCPEQAQIIRQVHDLLTQNLDKRYTIEELARKFHLNASTMKQAFKALYGQPIATYMKEYRIHKAMQLLQTTDLSIADIALQLGYRSQSRFSEAFKDIAHILPTDYRKQNPL